MSLPRGPRSRAGTPPRPLQAAIAQVGMELRLLSRRGENVFVTVVIPLVLLVFFSVVPAVDRGGVTFLLPGHPCPGDHLDGLVNLGISTAFERSYGVLKRLGGSPLPRSGLIAAKIATVVVVEVGQAVLLVGVAAGRPRLVAGRRSQPGRLPRGLRARDARLRRAGTAAGRNAPGRGDAGHRQRPVPGPSPPRRGGPAGRPPADAPRRPRPDPAGRATLGGAPDRPGGRDRGSARAAGPARGMGHRSDAAGRPHVPLGLAERPARRSVSRPSCAPRRAASPPRAGSPRPGAP